MLVAALATQAAGHPFVPMEPSLPLGRLVWYFQDGRPAVLLAAAGAAAQEHAQALLAAAGAEAAQGVRVVQVCAVGGRGPLCWLSCLDGSTPLHHQP